MTQNKSTLDTAQKTLNSTGHSNVVNSRSTSSSSDSSRSDSSRSAVGRCQSDDPQFLLDSIEKVLSNLGRSCLKMTTTLNKTVNNDSFDRSAYWILVYLSENEPIRLSDLALRLGVDISTVSRQVKNLFDAKFISKTNDSVDKRASLLVTTKLGQRYKQEVTEMRKLTIAKAMENWKVSDKEVLLKLLNKLVSELHNECQL